MFCTKCGHPIGDGKFCTACGAPVEAVTPENAENTETVSEASPVQTEPVVMVDPGKTNGTIALVLGIVALALGTICSCLFACLGGIVPLGCAVAGIIVGNKAMKASQAAGFVNNQGKIGLILSIVAIAIIVIFIIANAILGGAMALTEISM